MDPSDLDPYLPTGGRKGDFFIDDDGLELHGTKTKRRPKKEDLSAEQYVAGFIGLAVWAGVAYVGLEYTALAWYWPVGTGLLLAFGTTQLLLGPLYRLTQWIAMILGFLMLVGIGVILYKLFAGA
ncbi:hypothetical protein [Gallaecimonas sp. GXIMD4217]|uniref:hypothetical protein n=1 Tax=Gallaecimonas sp. GXIMD4217 TaxID=3131927 RepID=UPI00311B18A4